MLSRLSTYFPNGEMQTSLRDKREKFLHPISQQRSHPDPLFYRSKDRYHVGHDHNYLFVRAFPLWASDQTKTFLGTLGVRFTLDLPSDSAKWQESANFHLPFLSPWVSVWVFVCCAVVSNDVFVCVFSPIHSTVTYILYVVSGESHSTACCVGRLIFVRGLAVVHILLTAEVRVPVQIPASVPVRILQPFTLSLSSALMPCGNVDLLLQSLFTSFCRRVRKSFSGRIRGTAK